MLPRGIRNSNPGNLRHSATEWLGQSSMQPDPDFVTFDTPAYGIRALMRILSTYYYKYNLNTVHLIISRYAPPNENDTDAYTASVATRCSISSEAPIQDINEMLIPMTKAIVRHENGAPSAGYSECWYDDNVYKLAKQMLSR